MSYWSDVARRLIRGREYYLGSGTLFVCVVIANRPSPGPPQSIAGARKIVAEDGVHDHLRLLLEGASVIELS